jgi:hypothetical protein
MAASLLVDERRVTSGAGEHIVTVTEAGARLDLDAPVPARIDRMRRARHRAFYDGDEVSELELAGALAGAEVVLTGAARELGGGLTGPEAAVAVAAGAVGGT